MLSDSIRVASFATLSERLLPGMLQCPGTNCMKRVGETDVML